MDDSQLIRVRIKATGQIVDLLPAVARARVAGGTAELVEDKLSETAAVEPRAEAAVTAEHKPPKRKSAR